VYIAVFLFIFMVWVCDDGSSHCGSVPLFLIALTQQPATCTGGTCASTDDNDGASINPIVVAVPVVALVLILVIVVYVVKQRQRGGSATKKAYKLSSSYMTSPADTAPVLPTPSASPSFLFQNPTHVTLQDAAGDEDESMV
jgi:hypothetical protein